MREPSRSAWGPDPRLLALVIAIAGCHKSAPPGPDPDALWDLAPDGTKVGLVATPKAIGLAERALAAARALVHTPDFAVVAPIFDDAVVSVVGTGTLASAGLVPDQGFAVFGSPEGIVVILPVDRDKFLASQHGTRGAETDTVHGQYCKPVGAVYACASAKALFERIGKGSLRGKVAAVGGRGDIEIYAAGLPIEGKDGDAAIAIELEPGQIGVRASWTGPLPADIAALAKVASPRVDLEHASAFAVAEIESLLPDANDVPIVAGVTTRQLQATVIGPFLASVPAGTTDVQIQLPLIDPAPAQTLIDHCKELDKLLPLAAEQKPGACRIAIHGITNLDMDAWVEGNEVRLGNHKGPPPAGNSLAPTPIASELATGKWTYAFWGRGSILPSDSTLAGELAPEAKLTMRALSLVEELGAGIAITPDGLRIRGVLRTVWANPDDVAAKLVAITAEQATANGKQLGKAIAESSPESPFASDFASGQGGLMIPSAAAGLLAKMVVPAILRFRHRGDPPRP